MKWKPHPVAEMFPIIQEGTQAWTDLIESIKSVGQIEPIVVDGDTLLDGRNRLRACEAIGTTPKWVEWGKLGIKASQADWITAKNLERRHLTPEQKAAIAYDIDLWLAKEINEGRQKATQFKEGCTAGPGRGKKTVSQSSDSPFSEDCNDRKTVSRIAKKAGTSRYAVEQAQKVKRAVEAGELGEGVWNGIKNGTVKTSEAVKQIPKPKSKAAPTLKDRVTKSWRAFIGKFAVADHPGVKEIVRELIAE